MRKLKRNFPTIGVLAGWQTYRGTIHNFLGSVYTGIRSAANVYQCNLLIGCGINSPLFSDEKQTAFPVHSPEIEFVPIGTWNTDGLIVIGPLSNPESMEYLQEISKNGFPVVFAGDLEKRPCVVINNENGIIQAVDHLVSVHGQRKIAFLAGEHTVEGDSAARLRGYRMGLAQHNIPYDPEMVVYGMHNERDSYHATQELLRRSRNFQGMITSNDDAAVGAIQAIHEAGLSVPQDIAVIGFDDLLQARAQIPLLTTVHHPMFETGYQSTRLLYQILMDEVPDDTLIRIPANLIVRESCGCLPGTGIYNQAAHTSQIFTTQPAQPDQNARMVQILTESIDKEMQRLTSQEVEYLCSRILDALLTSLKKGDSDIFHLTFQQILEHIANSDEDLYAWQKVISWLKEFLPALAQTSQVQLTPLQINDMLHRARIAISEVSRGQFSRLLLNRTHISDQIGVLTSLLFASKSENEIFDILSRSLTELNIQSAAIAYYDLQPKSELESKMPCAERAPDRQDAAIYQWSQLKTTLPGMQPRFLTRQFPPDELYPDNRPFQLLVLPIELHEGLIGFAAFMTTDIEPLGSIVRALGGALRHVKLYQDALAAQQMAEQARKQAEEANYQKSRFLSIVSHELRAPLNLIYGLSNIMLEQSQQRNELECVVNRKDLERIDIGAQHLESLIRDVIDLARSDMGQLKLVWESFNLLEILQAVSAIGERWASNKQLEWLTNLPEHLPHIKGDRTRLRQVIINLVNNAVKYTDHGKVSLAAWVDCDWVTVSVTDTGIGVPQEEQNLIFDEFHQSKRTTDRGMGGMGLGLAICRRLVEMHGGEISLESSGVENGGSAFILRLPYLQTPAQEATDTAPQPQAERVLLLVHDLVGSVELNYFLTQKGFQVETHLFEEHCAWLQWFEASPPDKVVLDLGLTANHGWEILKTLKENPATQHIPVIFYQLENGQNTGSVLNLNLLTKPLNTNDLANELIAQGLLFTNRAVGQVKTILIVDDNPEMLELHTRILEPMADGYRILHARNGREALEIIGNVHPALVLLDLIMPEVDGFTVLEEMQADDACSNIPVIVLTSQNLTEEDTQRLNRCAASVLSKGIYTSQETLDHISAILSRKHKLNTETQHLVLKAMTFIHANYKEPISRSDVASYVGISERHVARCFQQGMGLSPMIYLNRYRVNVAKALLTEGQMNITDIALEVGFSTGGYFSRVFRQEVGCSPREYIQGVQSS